MADRMKSSSPPTWLTRWIVLLAILSVFVIAFLWVIYAPNTVFLTFAAVWFGCVLHHASKSLSRKTHLSSRVTLIFVLVMLVVLPLSFFLVMGLQMAQQFSELITVLQEDGAKIFKQARETIPLVDYIYQYTSAEKAAELVFQGKSGSTVASWLASPIGFTVNLIFIFFTGIYFASRPEYYRDGVISLAASKYQNRLKTVFDEVGYGLWRWTLARLASMVIVGVMSGVGLWLIGVPMAVTIGIFTGLVVFVPNIGPVLAILPPVVLGLSVSPMVAGYVVALYLGIEIIESYLITPLIHEHEDDLPAALVIIAQLVFGVLFGLLGVTFAMPVVLAIKILIQRLYIQRPFPNEAL